VVPIELNALMGKVRIIPMSEPSVNAMIKARNAVQSMVHTPEDRICNQVGASANEE